MSMQERMMNDLKKAMREKDAIRKGVLTLLRSGLASAEKEKHARLTEQEEITVIQRELKQTRQSLAEAENGNRMDIAEREKAKIEIIQTYLPKQLSEDEIASTLRGAGFVSGMKMGEAMKLATSILAGKAENALVSKVVRELIA